MLVGVSVTQLCPTLYNPMDCLLCPWDFPGRNNGVGCHFPLLGGPSGLIPGSTSLQADCLPQGKLSICLVKYVSWTDACSLACLFLAESGCSCGTQDLH